MKSVEGVSPAQAAGLSIVLCLATILQADAAAVPNASANALRDARRLVECVRASDEQCVFNLSDEDLFNRTGDSQFATMRDAQTHLLSNIRARGGYISFDLLAPGPPFAVNESLYIPVPYRARSNENGLIVDETAFYLGTSRDHGVSWKFLDGCLIHADNARRVLDGSDVQLPPCFALGQSAPNYAEK